MNKRDVKEGTPLSDLATGEWYRVPGLRKPVQRYDPAPAPEPAHWYLTPNGWSAFRDSAVSPTKTPATASYTARPPRTLKRVRPKVGAK